jgi:DNA-binding cell septation regulator SpoVG
VAPVETHLGLSVSEVNIRLVDGGADGLLAWASCVINGALHLNNIAIWRSPEGNIGLTYPWRRSKTNQRYFFFYPINRQAQETIDNAILGKMNAVRKP